jgi:hypothetical protein
MNFTVRDSTLVDNFAHVDVAQSSPNSLTYNVLNNTMSTTIANQSVDVNIFLSGASSGSWQPLQGNIVGNTMTANGLSGNGGIQITPQGPTSGTAGSVLALVSGNTVTTLDVDGINATAGQASSSNLTIKDNIVTVTAGQAADRAIRVQSGISGTDTTFVCAEISNNQTDAQGAPAGDIRIRAPFTNATFVLPGYGGSNTDSAAVIAFVHAKQNNATFPNVVDTSVGTPAVGKGFQPGSACVLPPAPPA